jgi:hypothetical protein
MGSIPSAVPSAVAPSTGDTVRILTEPQLGPYQPMTGSSRVPAVPNVANPDEVSPQPGYGMALGDGGQFNAGSAGAPTVPALGGALFRSPEIDAHYQSEAETRNPTAKVNNPPTRGMYGWVKDFANGIGLGSQDRTATGFNNRSPQQRTSHMRPALPPHGMGYAPEFFSPHQNPQQPNTYGYNPATGTQPYGTGVLNSDTFGAGQTAGGVGGSNYTPTPGPPPTNSTASQDIANGRGMPTWG